MEIKVGEYCRFKNGKIAKVKDVKNDFAYFDTEVYWLDGIPVFEIENVFSDFIVIHSFNIIDLIEIGDILRVFDNLSETEEKVNILDDEMLKAVKEDIKDNNYKILSILTHEQFSSLEYII